MFSVGSDSMCRVSLRLTDTRNVEELYSVTSFTDKNVTVLRWTWRQITRSTRDGRVENRLPLSCGQNRSFIVTLITERAKTRANASQTVV